MRTMLQLNKLDPELSLMQNGMVMEVGDLRPVPRHDTNTADFATDKTLEFH